MEIPALKMQEMWGLGVAIIAGVCYNGAYPLERSRDA